MPIEYFIRDSDNQIKMTLTEDDDPVIGAWTELDIYFGGVALHRTADGDGVSLNTSTGLLTLTPSDLTALEKADIAELSTRKSYAVRIVVKSALNDDGAVFGGSGSGKIIFLLSDAPPL